MAAEGDKSSDFYAVLGLKKESTLAELRLAYKKLALKWHPDRLSSSGNTKYLDEAKKKFQAIQQAYSVLSDANKRFLYDVGVYDSNDDEDNNGMGEFLDEMVTMMSQTKPEEGRNETLEELQELFDELFESDIGPFCSSSRSAMPPTCSSSSSALGNEAYGVSNKRNSTEIRSDNLRVETSRLEGFCIGTSGMSGKQHSCGERNRRKNARTGRR